MDKTTQAKIAFSYLLSMPRGFIKLMIATTISLFIGVVPDKYFVSLADGKSSKIVNVVRQYTVHYDQFIPFQLPNSRIIYKAYDETRIENITYGFRYLFENLSSDNSILLNDLTKYITFDYLIIDYLKDDKIVKKIIHRVPDGYDYVGLNLNKQSNIPFGRIEF